MEIYNEQIKDLLNPESGLSLDVREAPGRGTFVSGAANVEVCELARRVHAVHAALVGVASRAAVSRGAAAACACTRAFLERVVCMHAWYVHALAGDLERRG